MLVQKGVEVILLNKSNLRTFDPCRSKDSALINASTDSAYVMSGVGLLKEGTPVGLGWGVQPVDNLGFYSLDEFFILPEFHDPYHIRALFCELFKMLIDKGIKKIGYKYRIPEQGDYSREIISCLQEEYGNKYRISKRRLSKIHYGFSSKLTELQRHKWYRPTALPEGFHIKKWDEYSQKWKAKIKEREKKTEEGYVGPFFTDAYDKTTSIVLVRDGSEEPVGWMITCPLGEDMILIRRYYIYKEYRKLLLGPIMGSIFLENFSSINLKFGFKVAENNRSMNTMVRHFLSPLLNGKMEEIQLLVEKSN